MKYRTVITCSQRTIATSILALWGIGVSLLSAQTLEASFLEKVKCSKNTRTAALVRVWDEGFQVLRLQTVRPKPEENATVEVPLLVNLQMDGSLESEKVLPGFGAEAGFALTWHWAIPGRDALLVAYGGQDGRVGVRRFDLLKKDWDGVELPLFSDQKGPFPTLGWHSAPNGGYHLVYGTAKGQCWLAMFDQHFALQWRRSVDLSQGKDPISIAQFFCTQEGKAVVHAHAFLQVAKGLDPAAANPETTCRATWPNGARAVPAPWPTHPVAYSHCVGVYGADAAQDALFYPAVGKGHVTSLVFNQSKPGTLYAAGFAGSEPGLAENWFLYALNLRDNAGKMLQNMPVSPALRKAYLSEKEVSQKQPIPGLCLRRLEWTVDGTLWALAEQEAEGGTPSERLFKDAVLMRVDSTYKLTGGRPIEKRQRHAASNVQFFGGMAPIRAPKGGWLLGYNHGVWPNNEMLLVECKRSGAAMPTALANCQSKGCTLLPHTLTEYGDSYFFVAESEYREMFRVVEWKGR